MILLFFYFDIHPSPFTEVSLHLFIASRLSWLILPSVPSRELNSGLLYSTPSQYQLSYAAPYWSTSNPDWATSHPDWAPPQPTELRSPTELRRALWATPLPLSYIAKKHLHLYFCIASGPCRTKHAWLFRTIHDSAMIWIFKIVFRNF